MSKIRPGVIMSHYLKPLPPYNLPLVSDLRCHWLPPVFSQRAMAVEKFVSKTLELLQEERDAEIEEARFVKQHRVSDAH